jgi:ClpP class serine protease
VDAPTGREGIVMGLLDLFWIFFLISVLQPVLRQRLVEASRRRMIAQIEQQRGSRLILLVHRQETMSFLGFPVMRFIDVNDAEAVIRAVDLTGPDTPLDLVLHTPGGLALPSLQIARAIDRHKGKVTVHVPHYAMSGGTLIALAADEIVMSPHAVLGPLDPQIGRYPAPSILRVVEQKPIAEIDDETLILADIARKAISQLARAIDGLLRERLGAEAAVRIATALTSGARTHDSPITCDDARELGLPVQDAMPREILLLMNYFPQPVRRVRTVEYLPVPRGKPHRALPSGR